MDKEKSLNNKYQKIDAETVETPLEETKEKKVKEPKPPKEKKVKEPKPPKEKKVKEPKPPKEKKVKEPKPPKEKKVKEPKPSKEKKVKEPKPPKEKRVKEPKPPKEKKAKESKKSEELLQENFVPPVQEISYIVEEAHAEKRRVTEEIVFTSEKGTKKAKKSVAKKEKQQKPPKEKKVKEPKQPKEKKEKAPKVKKQREPLTKKDFATIGIALLAVLLIAGYFGCKYYLSKTPEAAPPNQNTDESKIADIQIAREGVGVVNLIQSDIPDVFYGFTANLKLCYYQYRDNKMVQVSHTGTIETEIDFGNEVLPVTINYVELGDKIFGIGLFRADEHEGVYFYNKMIFKLTNLPQAYSQDGKALLLATTSENALSQKEILWPESFTVDMQSGKTERFLSIVNRTMDMSGAGVADFCMLPTQGYSSKTMQIPFFSSREYGPDSGKQDIFIKNGNKEELFASDIYGKFFLTDGDSVIFMKKTNTGFDLIRKTGETEEIQKSFYGTMSEYLYSDDYILNKDNGKLYNMRTGEEKTLVGYRMSAEMMEISPDGKYLVMLGTVKSLLDYQVHIFNLETGDYAKYVDKNPSVHADLTFINNTTVVYTVVDPNQGKEYVVMDVSKAK
ncbi:MAG: hypothetical protein ACI4N4_01295 [Candidatus Fimenecus sp.]